MPTSVQLSDNRSVAYLYDAVGIKRKVTHQGGGENKTTEYCSNVIYENKQFNKVLTDEGYLTVVNHRPIYHYYLKDHLGNNRVVLNQDGTTVEQVNHYYPFGGVFDQTSEDVQRYKFGGKELDRTYALDLYDYSARYMDGAQGRFTTMDPLAEKYYGISPYAYGANNPMRFVDPTGMDWYSYDEEFEDEYGFVQIRTQYKYVEDTMSNNEIAKGGYTYLGKTYMSGDTYYSLGGSQFKFDLLDSQSMTAMSVIKYADRSVLATIDAAEGTGDFWDKYNGVISTGSNAATVLSDYLGASKGVSTTVTRIGVAITLPSAISDGQAFLNGDLKGMALMDAAMNVISLAGTPGAAIGLSYSGSKEVTKGIDFIKRGSEVGMKRSINSIFSWMGAKQLFK